MRTARWRWTAWPRSSSSRPRLRPVSRDWRASPVEPDPAGGFVLPLPSGRVRLLPPDALGNVFPGVAAPTLPYIAGITVRTDDANRAIEERARASGIAHRAVPDGLLIPPEEAGGAALLFRP